VEQAAAIAILLVPDAVKALRARRRAERSLYIPALCGNKVPAGGLRLLVFLREIPRVVRGRIRRLLGCAVARLAARREPLFHASWNPWLAGHIAASTTVDCAVAAFARDRALTLHVTLEGFPTWMVEVPVGS
jgi:hypothetical protein